MAFELIGIKRSLFFLHSYDHRELSSGISMPSRGFAANTLWIAMASYFANFWSVRVLRVLLMVSQLLLSVEIGHVYLMRLLLRISFAFFWFSLPSVLYNQGRLYSIVFVNLVKTNL